MTGQKLLPRVELDDGLVNFISRLCAKLEVDGLRAYLVMNKTARALAAWHGRALVTLDDIRIAAEKSAPYAVAQNHSLREAGDAILIAEYAAELSLHAEHGKVIRTYTERLDALGPLRAGQVRADRAHR